MPKSAGSAEREGARRLRRALAGPRRELTLRFPRLDRVHVDDVHRVRVATRRLRSQLELFGRAFDRSRARAARSCLRDVAHLLADVRTLDVLAALDDGRHSPLGNVIAGERSTAATELRRRTARRSTERLFERCLRLTDPDRLGIDPALSDAKVLRRVRRGWRRAARRLGEEPRGAKALHATRVTLKDARYALETVADLEPQAAAALDRQLRHAQDLLGQHHDAWAARDWLKAASVDAPTRRLVRDRLQARRERLERRIPAALARLTLAGDRWDRAVSRRLQATSTDPAPR